MEKEEIIIGLVEQIRDDVTDLSKSVARNNAKVLLNGVKLDNVLSYNAKCEKRLSKIEDWKAGHSGYAAGVSRGSSLFGSRVTLICTVGGFLLTLAGLWYVIVSPAINASASAINVIEAKFLALESLK